MKYGLSLVTVMMLVNTVYAKEIALPLFVLENLIGNPEQYYMGTIDEDKIKRHNKKHTKEYVLELLNSLNNREHKIVTIDRFSTIIHMSEPKNIEFMFERRMSKWVDGSDYPYYVLKGINELI